MKATRVAAAQRPLEQQSVQLCEDYARALERFLTEPGEAALASAYELGRAALTDGSGVLAMAHAHSSALVDVLSRHQDTDRLQLLERIEAFLGEVLSPFEMAHRGFRETNAVLRGLNEVLEGQAKRIASALHDEAAQLLVPTHLALADVASRLPPDTAKEIQKARALLDQMEDRLRNLAHELRPPILDDLGLTAAIEFLADSLAKRTGLSVTVEALVNRHLPATVETTLYRIIREALTNVARHAKAAAATVSLQESAHFVTCAIADDGIGINATPARRHSGGLGLIEIRERVAALGGDFRVTRGERGGTTLLVEIPL